MAVHRAGDNEFEAHLSEQLGTWCHRAGGSYELPSAEQKEYLTSERIAVILTKLLEGQGYFVDRLQVELQQIR